MKNFLTRFFRAIVAITIGIDIGMLVVNAITDTAWNQFTILAVCVAIVVIMFEGIEHYANNILGLWLGLMIERQQMLGIVAIIIINLAVISVFALMAARHRKEYYADEADEDDEDDPEA